jgi:hypothetical protein
MYAGARALPTTDEGAPLGRLEHAQWQTTRHGRTDDQRAPDRPQRRAVADTELRQQRRHVALDGTHGDEQPCRDLRVREPIRQRRQHLGFAPGHARLTQTSRKDAASDRHPCIVHRTTPSVHRSWAIPAGSPDRFPYRSRMFCRGQACRVVGAVTFATCVHVSREAGHDRQRTPR